jgi:hypothetical protein
MKTNIHNWIENNLFVLTRDWMQGFSKGDLILRGDKDSTAENRGTEYFNMTAEINDKQHAGLSTYSDGVGFGVNVLLMVKADYHDCMKVSHYFSKKPVVGQGATDGAGSDCYPYTVLSVSKDGLSCTIRPCETTPVEGFDFYANQVYNYSENENAGIIELRFRNGEWRQVCKHTVFTDEWADKTYAEKKATGVHDAEDLTPFIEQGIMRVKTSYPKMNIYFGSRKFYQDPSF